MFFLACGFGCDGSHQNQAWTSCYMGSLDYSCSLQLLSPCCVVLPFSPVAGTICSESVTLNCSALYKFCLQCKKNVAYWLVLIWGLGRGEIVQIISRCLFFKSVVHLFCFQIYPCSSGIWRDLMESTSHYAFKQSCVQNYLGFSLKLLLDYALLFSTIPSEALSGYGDWQSK